MMLDIADVKRNFPFEKFRKYQDAVLGQIVDAFNSGKKLIIVEAPTGFGKSPVNVALARSFDKAYIVTTQKVLQDQYLRDFSDVVTIKGRNNYPCVLMEGFNCENAICQIDENFDCEVVDQCEYLLAKSHASRAEITIMNVAYAFFCDRGAFPKRELLVVDEAHNLDMLGLDKVSITINLKMFNETVPDYNNLDDYVNYFIDLVPLIKRYINKNVEKYQNTKKEVYANNVKRARRLLHKIKIFIDDVDEGHEWIWERDTKQRKIKFQPITVGRFLKKLIWDLGEKYIVSSATIIDAEMFMKECGLNFCNGYTSWIKVPHTFPVENRKIYFIPSGKMSKEYKDKNIGKVADCISLILQKHSNERVIIHSHSYENAEMLSRLVKANKERKLIIQHEGERDMALEEFLSNPAAVYFSVKMTEGIDLAYDKARVNIVAKTMFPFIGNKRVSKRLEYPEGDRWYKWKTILELSQAQGRTTRAPDDWSVTYILDSDFGYLYHTSKHLFPEWFIDAIDWSVREIDVSQREVVKTVYKVARSIQRVYGDFTLAELKSSLDERKDGFTDEQISMAVKLLASNKKIYKLGNKKWKVVGD